MFTAMLNNVRTYRRHETALLAGDPEADTMWLDHLKSGDDLILAMIGAGLDESRQDAVWMRLDRIKARG